MKQSRARSNMPVASANGMEALANLLAADLPGSPSLGPPPCSWLFHCLVPAAKCWYSTRLQEDSRRPQPDEMRSIFARLGLGGDFSDPQSDSFD
jgi:hypothetical protein